MNDIEVALRRLARQDQFLEVVDRDEAITRFHRHLDLRSLGIESVPLDRALNRALARPVIAEVDVPGLIGQASMALRSAPATPLAVVGKRPRSWS